MGIFSSSDRGLPNDAIGGKDIGFADGIFVSRKKFRTHGTHFGRRLCSFVAAMQVLMA